MTCQICGAKSGFFPICKDCNKLKEEGKITKCEGCGLWKKGDKPLCYECWLKNNDSKKKTTAAAKKTAPKVEKPVTSKVNDSKEVKAKA